MFTGIITDIGTLLDRRDDRFDVLCHYDVDSIDLGASIACDGCCLTVVERNEHSSGKTIFSIQVSPETLNLTTLNNWQKGQKINLERALKMGDEFGGHIVSGHVDGVAMIENVQPSGSSHIFTLSIPKHLKKFIASKGSVTLNGVSLTVNEVKDNKFDVNIIPHTYSSTTWHECKKGSSMNVEVDLLARYVLRANEIKGDQ